MNGSLSNSSAVARWSGSNVKARPRKVRNLKARMFKWTMVKKIGKNKTIINSKLNLAEIVFQLLNSGRPLEAIKNIALIGDSFMYGGWPWTESYTVLYQIYSPGQKVMLIRTNAGLKRFLTSCISTARIPADQTSTWSCHQNETVKENVAQLKSYKKIGYKDRKIFNKMKLHVRKS